MSTASLTALSERATGKLFDLRDTLARFAPAPSQYASANRAMLPMALIVIVMLGVVPLFHDSTWSLRMQDGMAFGLLCISLNILSNPMAKAAALLSNRQPSLPSPIRPRSDPLQGPAVLRDAELLAKDKWIACGWSGSPWRQVRMLRSRTILADPLSCRRMSQHCSASLP